MNNFKKMLEAQVPDKVIISKSELKAIKKAKDKLTSIQSDIEKTISALYKRLGLKSSPNNLTDYPHVAEWWEANEHIQQAKDLL